MLTIRRIWSVLVGVWLAAFLASGLLGWVLGLEGPGVVAAVLIAGVLGGVASIGEARGLEPLPAAERRDTIQGWAALIGGVAAIACLHLPMPWGALAAATVLAATVLGLQRVPRGS